MFNQTDSRRKWNNRALEALVVQYLADCDVLVLPPLHISATEGVLTLRGAVDNESTRCAVLAAARLVPGVDKIIDKLEVRGTGDGQALAPRCEFSTALIRFFEEQRRRIDSSQAASDLAK